jgi:predicted dehydrogenase
MPDVSRFRLSLRRVLGGWRAAVRWGDRCAGTVMTRIAVVGAGIMGTNHVRVLRTLGDCKIVGVVDTDQERGEKLAAVACAPYLSDAGEVSAIADAAILAVPSEKHAAVGIPLLEAGLDLLVEKPIATDVADAAALVAAAERADRILMIGHVERYNPAALELSRLVADPIHIALTRVGPFSSRVTVDVVLDLMIHDLDLVLSLVGAPVAAVQAMGRNVRSEALDIATALVRFENGVTATVTASRAGQTKIRQIELTQRENSVVADLIRQDVTINRVDHSEILSNGGMSYRQTGHVEIPFLENRGEPLALELEHFVDCVTRRSRPRTDGAQGLNALALALRIRELAMAA